MSDTESTSITASDVPELFPLPEASRPQFAQVTKLSFGWVLEHGEHDAQFQLQKLGTFRGWAPLKSWPLTRLGWQSACAFMSSTHPELFEKTCEAARLSTERRVALERSAEFQRIRHGQASLGTLAGCVLLGGYGVEAGISATSKVDLHFTRQEIWLTKATGNVPYLRKGYEAARALEFEGGVVRTGGGYFGGGFGAVGAAEGVAMAKLLNSLTSKSSVHTTIRLEAEDAEVFLFTDQATPKTLLMKFAEVRARIAAAPPQLPQIPVDGADDLSEQLTRLGALFEKGLLTAEEFAAAKRRLLG